MDNTTTIILFIIVLAYGSILALRPVYGICLFIILRPIIDSFEILRLSYVVNEITYLQLIGILFPASLIFSSIVNKINLFKSPHINIGLVFLIFCIPSVFLSVPITNGIDNWLKLFTLWIVVAFTYGSLKNKGTIKTVFRSFIIASIYPIVKFLLSFINNETLIKGGLERYTGGYFHMGPASFILLLLIPAFVYLFISSNKFYYKIFSVFIIVYLVICIYFTYYRSTLVGVFIFFAVLLVLKKRFILISIGAIFLLLAVLTSGFIYSRFSPLIVVIKNLPVLADLTNDSFDHLLSGRFGIWRFIITQYLYNCQIENIFFGFGYNQNLQYHFEPHNDYLNIFYRHGLIPMLTFILFLFSTTISGLKNIKNNDFIVISLSILIASIIIANVTNYFISVRVALYVGVYMAILLKTKEFYRDANRE